VKPKLKKERKRPPKKWKRKKRKRETPQKEWQAKCTRTRARAHIGKKISRTKQNKTDPTQKRARLYLENMMDGNSYLTPLRLSESQADPEPPTTASNKT